MPPIRLHKTVGVRVGLLQVGGGAPVAVQSMTNTDTNDIESTARQCIELAQAGSEMVRITVNLPEPGHIHRGAGKHGAAHTVFRAGEVHGRITPRAEEICRLVGYTDSAKVTSNLWGERWSKLVANVMGNGLSACTGLPGGEILQSEPLRRFSTRLGSEAIRVGQAQGYQLEEILHLPPDTIARDGEGDEAAMRACDEQRFKDGKRTSSAQRPSMGQDMQKGRRTEIEFLNGLVVREGEKIGLPCAANAVLTDIVKRVERGELSPDPRHITELRMN